MARVLSRRQKRRIRRDARRQVRTLVLAGMVLNKSYVTGKVPTRYELFRLRAFVWTQQRAVHAAQRRKDKEYRVFFPGNNRLRDSLVVMTLFRLLVVATAINGITAAILHPFSVAHEAWTVLIILTTVGWFRRSFNGLPRRTSKLLRKVSAEPWQGYGSMPVLDGHEQARRRFRSRR